jgi:hypothetical protein
MVFGVLARSRILLMTAQERLGAGQPSAKLDRILERARENAVECRKFSW